MLKFDPNVKPTLNLWATYIPTRTTKPKFSTHRIVAHAKSALGSSSGIIYEFVDGEWVERYRRDESDELTGKKVCDGCGSPHSYPRYNPSRKPVPGGRYLHGGWRKGEFVYEWWCGLSRTCKG